MSVDTNGKSPEETEDRVMGFTLRKGEKLRHRTLIDKLFADGESLYDFPFRVTYRLQGRDEIDVSFRTIPPSPIDSLQMLITVPKKKRRRAVDRVLLRRRVREAYRLNRHSLRKKVESLDGEKVLTMAIIYIHDKNTDYSLIEKKMRNLFRKIEEKIK